MDNAGRGGFISVIILKAKLNNIKTLLSMWYLSKTDTDTKKSLLLNIHVSVGWFLYYLLKWASTKEKLL